MLYDPVHGHAVEGLRTLRPETVSLTRLDTDQLSLRRDLIEAAGESGWVDSQFGSRLRSRSGRVVWLDSREDADTRRVSPDYVASLMG